MSGRLSVSCDLPVPPGPVYDVLADYREKHPAIIPREYFRRLTVLEGGRGAGTRTEVEMRVLGTTKIFQHIIEEPEPGRRLVERDASGFSTTTFTVDAIEGGSGTRLTIETVFADRGGILGGIERALTAAMLRRIYTKELANLESLLKSTHSETA